MAVAEFPHSKLWIERMRQSLKASIAALLLTALGASSALAQSTVGPPEVLAPAAPTPKVEATPPAPAPAAPSPTAATPAAPPPSAAPAAAVAPAAPSPVVAPSCLPEIAKAEKRYRVPDGLLVSIALVESGRRDPDSGILAPWPWTINTHGQGAYFDTIDEAAAAAGDLLAHNDGLVDVGCMQVDLYHHPHAFKTLLAAFDPETNVDYAARYLVELKDRNGTWASAIAAYNAGDPALGGEYVARVLYYWKDVGTSAAAARVVADRPERRGFLIDTRPAPLEIAAEFVEKKDYPAAVAIYRAILSGAPDDQTAMLGLAQTYRATGHDDEARQQLERLLTENPDNRAALITLLNIIDAMAEPQRMTALLSARQVVPATAQIPARLAMLEEARGNRNEALSHMGAAVQLAPGDPILLLNYALLLDKGGFRTASIAAYTQFLEMYRPGTIALTVSLEQIKKRLVFLRSSAK